MFIKQIKNNPFRKEHALRKKQQPIHHRNFEIDYVLDKINDLSWLINKSNLAVLDIGATESLLLYELEARNYTPIGLDVRNYHTELPKNSLFYRGDITNSNIVKEFKNLIVYFIVALSSIEHIGLGVYGDTIKPNGDRLSIENIHKILHDDGYFIITVPMKYWQTDSGRGYTPKEFLKLIEGLFTVFHSDLKGGQICATLVKV